MERAVLVVLAVLLMVVGAIFTGQGLGFIPGSFMTGRIFWAVVGAAMLLAGGGILLLMLRRR